MPLQLQGVRMAEPTHGFTVPRIWTKPLRDLNRSTSRGFEVITFAKDVLGVTLFPWQEWLLIHMLELNEDGTLRFPRVLVIVGRQAGKTLMAAVLAAFWLYVDSARWPGQLREMDFTIVGSAQKLDIAMKPWEKVRAWACPDDPKVGVFPERVPLLQSVTYPPRMMSSEVYIRTHGGARYLPRTFSAARGQSAARLILDELREQYDFTGWSAIEKSANAMFDSQLVAFSNAGTAKSKVLESVRSIAHQGVDDPDTVWFVAEWSAEPDAALDDPIAFAQANPSAGYLPGQTIQGLISAAAEAPDESVERIEVLGQWITAQTHPLIPTGAWLDYTDEGSQIMPGSEMALAVDVDWDRKYAAVAVAGWRADGLPHVEAIAHRAGIMWTVPFIREVAEAQGIRRVAVRSRGAAASELVGPLRDAGLEVVEVAGPADGQAAGQLRDDVLAGKVRHRGQQPVNDAFAACEPSTVGGVEVFERRGAALSTSPGIACAYALWALRNQSGAPPLSAYEPDEPDGEPGVPWWRKG
jgi:hypothetical protein